MEGVSELRSFIRCGGYSSWCLVGLYGKQERNYEVYEASTVNP